MSTVSHDDVQAVVTYRWPCGCSALCADGYKCSELAWCGEHQGLLWFPEREADGEADGATVS